MALADRSGIEGDGPAVDQFLLGSQLALDLTLPRPRGGQKLDLLPVDVAEHITGVRQSVAEGVNAMIQCEEKGHLPCPHDFQAILVRYFLDPFHLDRLPITMDRHDGSRFTGYGGFDSIRINVPALSVSAFSCTYFEPEELKYYHAPVKKRRKRKH